MNFIECEKVQGTGYCTDNDCSCILTPLLQGDGYIFISEEVVDFRKDALSLAEVQVKLKHISGAEEYISISRYAPILICETAAQKRNLDLSVAKEDALMYWKEGRVPLRPTPYANRNGNLPWQNTFPQIQQNNIDQVQENSVNDFNGNELKSPDLNEATDYRPTFTTNEMNKQESGLPDVSVDDVLARFSSGPLAEFAKKMAQDQENAKLDSSGDSFSESLEKTVITISSKLKEIKEEEVERVSSKYSSERQIPLKEKKRKTKSKSSKNSVLPIWVVIGILLTLSVISAITVSLIIKFLKPKKETVVVQPQIQLEQQMEITRSFFEKSYSFEDALYKGTINFTDFDDSSGKYAQSVISKDKEKNYTVRGIFTYSVKQISFRPDSYSKDIQWVLDEYDQEGNFVFSDPNIENARIYLHIDN